MDSGVLLREPGNAIVAEASFQMNAVHSTVYHIVAFSVCMSFSKLSLYLAFNRSSSYRFLNLAFFAMYFR